MVDKVSGAATSWFFKAGGHTTDGIDFKVTVFAGAELACSFKRSVGVFGEVAKRSKCM